MSNELIAIGLVLMSALFNAGMNSFHIRAHDKLVFRSVLALCSGTICLPMLFFVEVPDASLWVFLLGSAVIHMGYHIVLANSYRFADLSLAHPLARGIGAGLTGVGAFLTLNEAMSGLQWLGLVMTGVGIVAFAIDGRIARANPKGIIFSLLTGLFIASYTLVDATGVRQSEVVGQAALAYIMWFMVLEGFGGFLTIFVWAGPRKYIAAARMDFKGAFAAAVGAVITYTLALYAYTFSDHTAPLAALRESSAIFTAIIGTVFLGEGFGRRRVIAAIVVVTGLVLMQRLG